MFDLKEVVNWLMKFGCPSPTFANIHVDNPGGVWDYPELIFTNGEVTYEASVDLLTREPNGPGTAVVELAQRGLAPLANPNTRVDFPAKVVIPPPPAYVDAFVGLPDPAHLGLFQPTPTVSSMWLYGQFVSGQPYYSSTGRKFRIVPIGGGLMTTFAFSEIVG